MKSPVLRHLIFAALLAFGLACSEPSDRTPSPLGNKAAAPSELRPPAPKGLKADTRLKSPAAQAREILDSLNCAGGRFEELKLKAGKELRCLSSSGEAQGPFAVLNSAGKVVLRGNNQGGERHGDFVAYWEDGSVQLRGSYFLPEQAQAMPRQPVFGFDDEGIEEARDRLLLPDGSVWLSRERSGKLKVANESAPGMGSLDSPAPPSSALSSQIFQDRSLAPGVAKENGVLNAEGLKSAQTLMKTLQNIGPAPMIVSVRSGFVPEGKLPNDRVSAQRSEIQRRQQGRMARLAKVEGSTPGTAFESIPFMSLKLDAEGLAELLLDPEVESIAPDRLSKPLLENSIPYIGAEVVHNAEIDGTDYVVAVVDTGVQADHPFFGGRVVEEACYSNANNKGAGSTLCPNGQGSQLGEGAGEDCDPSENDSCGHGTHVAGIVAGKSSTREGVASGASIFSLQVFTEFNEPDICNGSLPCAVSYDSDQISALQRIYERRNALNIAAVNMSLGGGQYSEHCDGTPGVDNNTALKAAIDNLRSVGIATVIASGNESLDGKIASPACISTAIAVGSTRASDDSVSYFSNHSSLVDLLAPGTVIYSAYPYDQIVGMSGTSMAAPHVAGAFALLRKRSPNASVDELLQALVSTGKPVSRNGVSVPRIQVDEAIAALGVEPPTFDPPETSFVGSLVVTLDTSHAGAKIRYTTDGSTPTRSHGTEVDSGSMFVLSESTTLKAITVADNFPVSEVSQATYSKMQALDVVLGPEEAIVDGGKWRLPGPVLLNFDDDLSDAFSLATRSGEAAWSYSSAQSTSGTISLKSGKPFYHPTDGEQDVSSVLQLAFESSGGFLSFDWMMEGISDDYLWFRYYDADDNLVNSETLGTGPSQWTRAEFEMAPGEYTAQWIYFRNSGDEIPSGAAFIDNLRLPGDQWRSELEEPMGPLYPQQYPLLFAPLAGWKSPQATADLRHGDDTVYANYSASTLSVQLEPEAARQAGAAWRIVGDAEWQQSGSELRLAPGSYSIEFKELEAWESPQAQEATVASGESTALTGTFTQLALDEPEILSPAGLYTSPIHVVLKGASESDQLRYTLDGSTPEENAELYTAPFLIPAATSSTVKVRAFRNGWLPSSVVSAVFVITGKLAAPVSNVAPGEVEAGTHITLSSPDPDATIRYTLDNSPVDLNSDEYLHAIEIPANSTVVIRAKAFRSDWETSEELVAVFTGKAEDPGNGGDPGNGEEPGNNNGSEGNDPDNQGPTDSGKGPDETGDQNSDSKESQDPDSEEEGGFFSCNSTGANSTLPGLALLMLLALPRRRGSEV